jgi:hypothetical protein
MEGHGLDQPHLARNEEHGRCLMCPVVGWLQQIMQRQPRLREARIACHNYIEIA